MRRFFKGRNQSILKPVLLASASIGQWIIVWVSNKFLTQAYVADAGSGFDKGHSYL